MATSRAELPPLCSSDAEMQNGFLHQIKISSFSSCILTCFYWGVKRAWDQSSYMFKGSMVLHAYYAVTYGVVTYILWSYIHSIVLYSYCDSVASCGVAYVLWCYIRTVELHTNCGATHILWCYTHTVVLYTYCDGVTYCRVNNKHNVI